MKKVILLILAMVAVGYSQQSVSMKAFELFDADSLTNNAYLTLTNAETQTGTVIPWFDNSGNLRVSAAFDTVSGTTKVFMDIGYKVLETGTDAFDWKYVIIDSFLVADDHTSQTYTISDVDTYPFFRDPVIALRLRFRQTGTQVNKIWPGITYLEF